MKTTTARAIVQIDANDLREFEPVNETLATEFFISKSLAKHKKFGLIDLWNCRNKRRRHGVRIR